MKTLHELCIETREQGAMVKIRAVPGASRECIVGLRGDALKVAVAVPAEKGAANKRIIQVLAKALGISANSILLVSGLTSRDKRILIRGFAKEELRRLLAAQIQG